MNKIFTDENNNHKIDLSKTIWASDKMHEDYKQIRGSLLKDIDWVAYDGNAILLIEYKNYNKASYKIFNEARNGDDLAMDVAKKFYDSLLFFMLNDKPCNKIRYVFILERHDADTTIQKKLRNKISKKLPFTLQDIYKKTIIDSFEMISVDEWNSDPQYSMYPISSAT